MSENLVQKEVINFDNISKVANVEVTLCAELGKAHLSLKDVIDYDEGSIITLDKLNNEPINIFVDDILIAKAQIVAIEDSYGIKITELVDNKSIENKSNGENR